MQNNSNYVFTIISTIKYMLTLQRVVFDVKCFLEIHVHVDYIYW